MDNRESFELWPLAARRWLCERGVYDREQRAILIGQGSYCIVGALNAAAIAVVPRDTPPPRVGAYPGRGGAPIDYAVATGRRTDYATERRIVGLINEWDGVRSQGEMFRELCGLAKEEADANETSQADGTGGVLAVAP